jgi:hypothetical protein
MGQQPVLVRLRHALIRSQWRRWFLPALCSLPYLLSMLWLLLRGQFWIAQVLLAPLLMAAAIGLLTLGLARAENGQRGPWT